MCSQQAWKTVDAEDTPKSTMKKKIGNVLSELAIHPGINTSYTMLNFWRFKLKTYETHSVTR